MYRDKLVWNLFDGILLKTDRIDELFQIIDMNLFIEISLFFNNNIIVEKKFLYFLESKKNKFFLRFLYFLKVGKVYSVFYNYRAMSMLFSGVCISIRKKSLKKFNSMVILRGYIKDICVEIIFPLFFSILFLNIENIQSGIDFSLSYSRSKIYFLSFKFNSWRGPKPSKFNWTKNMKKGYLVLN